MRKKVCRNLSIDHEFLLDFVDRLIAFVDQEEQNHIDDNLTQLYDSFIQSEDSVEYISAALEAQSTEVRTYCLRSFVDDCFGAVTIKC